MAFDKDIPTSGTSLRASNPQILANQSALQSALDQDHEFTNASGSAQSGKHQVITIKEQATPGASSSNEAYLTAVDSGTQPELEFTSEDGTAVTLTKDGDLYANNNLVVDGDIDVNTDKFTVAGSTGNTEIAGTLDVVGNTGIDGDLDVNTDKFTVASATGNTAIAGTLDVTGASGLSGILTMASDIVMGSNSITGLSDGDSDGDAINFGQYEVDDVRAASMAGASNSVTFPNGLIVKFGSATSTSVSFGSEPFPNGCLYAVACYNLNQGTGQTVSIYNKSVSGMSISQKDVNNVTQTPRADWIAIGY